MRRAPATIGPDASVRAAVGLMRRQGVRHLLVTEDDRLRGVVTDRDVRRAAFLPMLEGHLAGGAHRLAAPRVRDVMTWSVVTIGPDASLDRAALLMYQHRVGSLPVTEDGRPVGILTERDVLHASRQGAAPGPPPEAFLG
jgi:acetoin utilization protein AcuB